LLRSIDPSRLRRYAVILAALWLLSSGVHDIGLVLVFLPAAVLFAALVSGHAPGEALVTRLREMRHPPRRRVRLPTGGARRGKEARRTSGGTLLARRLAGRAPPRFTLATN
jgi:hypothetical protein